MNENRIKPRCKLISQITVQEVISAGFEFCVFEEYQGVFFLRPYICHYLDLNSAVIAGALTDFAMYYKYDQYWNIAVINISAISKSFQFIFKICTAVQISTFLP